MWIFPDFLSYVLLMIFINIKCQWDFIMGKETCSSTLRLSWPTYSRQGIRVQKNSYRLCGIFNSDRNQIKLRWLHKRKPPLFWTRFYWNCEYKGTYAYLENASRSTKLEVLQLHLNECLRIRISFFLHKVLSIQFIASVIWFRWK